MGGIGFVGLAGALYYVFSGSDEEHSQPKKQQGGGKQTKHDVEQLDLDDLDPEERKLLAEVSKKGYYHGRPKNENAPSPQRIDDPKHGSMPKRRAEFDDFQKKWDQFADEKFIG